MGSMSAIYDITASVSGAQAFTFFVYLRIVRLIGHVSRPRLHIKRATLSPPLPNTFPSIHRVRLHPSSALRLHMEREPRTQWINNERKGNRYEYSWKANFTILLFEYRFNISVCLFSPLSQVAVYRFLFPSLALAYCLLSCYHSRGRRFLRCHISAEKET